MAMDKKTKEELREERRAHDALRQKAEKRSGMIKMIVVWAGIAVLLVLGVYAMIKTAGTSSTDTTQNPPIAISESAVPPVTAADNVDGSNSAKLTLVEYADFQCPACGNYYHVLKQLKQTYLASGKVRFVYRYFPLTNIHPNAMHSAQAAFAAGKQGKFWEMHDMLYENQAKWADLPGADADKTFLSYAKTLQLDTDKYTEDLNSKEATDTIKSQEDKGIELGVNSTPTFYLNNKLLTNPAGYDAFKALIDSQLAK